MGLELISVGSTSPWYSKIASPVTRGLEGWFCFDTDISRVGFNRVKDKPDARIIGTPSVNAGYARFAGLSAYLQTEIADSEEMTIMAICRSTTPSTSASDGVMFAGAHAGVSVTPGASGAAGGANLYVADATSVYATASRSNGAGGTTVASIALAATPPASWALRAMRASAAGGTTKIFDLTTGTSALRSGLLSRALSGNKYRIGSATVDYTGQSDISHVVIASAAWTDAEIASVAALMRKRAARLGINI